MPWVKLDDTFYDNPTNRSLGPAGRDLFVAGLAYCAKGLTDGVIPKGDLQLVLAQAQAKRSLVDRLIGAGRWSDEGDHFLVSEYLTYQPSKAKVLADREHEREKKRRQRQAGARASRQGANGRFVPPGTTQVDNPGGVPGGGPPLPVPSRPPTRGCTTAAADTPTLRQQRIDEACLIVATQRAHTRTDVGPGWVRAAAKGLAADHHHALHAHLAKDPTATAEQLAQHLESAPPERRLILPPTHTDERIADLDPKPLDRIPDELRQEGLAAVRVLQSARSAPPEDAA
jgi:hypothetical protein